MCDGSVRTLNFSIDSETHRRLSNRKNGEARSTPEVLNDSGKGTAGRKGTGTIFRNGPEGAAPQNGACPLFP